MVSWTGFFGILNGVVLLFLSLVHFYWATGKVRGFEAALPTTPEGDPLIKPTRRDCVVVGAGLLLFSLFYLFSLGEAISFIPPGIRVVVGWGIPLIFLLRAIGEFRYVGFFKSINSTPFARRDTRLYSPLCVFIAVVGFMAEWLKNS